jgi:hypothetical protein
MEKVSLSEDERKFVRDLLEELRRANIRLIV